MTASDQPHDSGTEREYRTDWRDDLPADRETFGGSRSMETPEEPDDVATGSEDDGVVPDLNRRDYLRAVGAAGVAGSLAGASSQSAAAQSGDWEAAAEERIQEHRTGDLEVRVENQAGNAVSGADVEVVMQEHDYMFGTAINAEFLVNQEQWGDPIHTADDQQKYQERVEEYFNAVVFENYHKWGIWETDWQNPDETAGNPPADDAVDWARERGMDVRGHVCVWGNINAYAIPPDVVEAMGVSPNDQNINYEHDDFTQADHDPELIRERSMNQIERIIDYYGEDVTEWEVVNEVPHVPDMIRAVEGNGYQDSSVDHLTAPILGDWYEKAEEVVSEYDDMTIAINDYNTMVGPFENDRSDYEEMIQFLVEDRGIDMDGIGFQCHFGSDQTLTPDQILENLDRFSEYADGLRATEFDMFEGNWTEQEQADFIYTFLKTFFSHPDTDHFLVWNIWDPLHWGDELDGEQKDAPFYREDWSEKPALGEYTSLVFEDWWTEESGTSGSDGTYSVSAFLGEHQVSVSTEEMDEPVTETVYVDDADGTTELVVEVEGGEDPCADAEGGSMEVDGQTVCDVNGDGAYRDVNGDGSVGQDDVTAFFEVQHKSAWQQDGFDFSGNGEVNQFDVVDLFDYTLT